MARTLVVYSNRKGVQRPAGFNLGPGAVVVAQGIYEESSTQKARLGTRLQVGDRVFRYALSGGAIVAGYTVQSAAVAGAGTTDQVSLAVTVAAAIDDTHVHVCALTTEQTANLFAEGYAHIFETGVFLGQVKSNTTLATSGTVSYIELYDGIPVALTTSAQVGLMTNPFKSVITTAHATSQTGGFLGVAPRAIQSGYYFWLQTNGPCAVVPQAALSLDELVCISDSTAGQVEKDSGSANAAIGFPMQIGTAGEGAIINLRGMF